MEVGQFRVDLEDGGVQVRHNVGSLVLSNLELLHLSDLLPNMRCVLLTCHDANVVFLPENLELSKLLCIICYIHMKLSNETTLRWDNCQKNCQIFQFYRPLMDNVNCQPHQLTRLSYLHSGSWKRI